MPDTDPPNEIDDREAPADRNVYAPDANTLGNEVGNGDHQHHHDRETQCESSQPALRSRSREDDRADLVRDRSVGVPRSKNGSEPRNLGRIDWRLAGAHAFSSSGFGLRTAARYVVRGRVLSSPRIG